MEFTRREFLRAGSAAALAGGAGCADVLDEPTPEVERPLAERAFAQFRGGLARLGYFPERTVPDAVRVAWSVSKVNTGDHTAAKASAVPAPDGNVLVPGDNGMLRSVTPEGDQNWVTNVSNATRGIHGTPAVANGVAYIGAYDGTLYALDLETGREAWSTDLGDAIGSSPAYHQGTVYIAVEYYDPDGSVFGVDAATGEVEWESPRPDNHPHSTIAIDRDAGYLTVGSNDGRLYAWSYPDLTFRWSYDTGRPIKGPVATHDGAAFVGSWDDHVHRVDLATGEADWTFETGNFVMSGPSIDTDDGVCYVGSHDHALHALDVESGEELWAFETGGRVVGCPAVTRDHVVFGSKDTALYAVRADDGEEVWSVDVDGWVTSTPRLADDGVYFAERAPEAGGGGKFYKLIDV